MAFSKDEYLTNLSIPRNIEIGVMINAVELLPEKNYENNLKILFPNSAEYSPVKLVRLAAYYDEIHIALEASKWLVENGFKVGINLMQISEITNDQLISITQKINEYRIFA